MSWKISPLGLDRVITFIFFILIATPHFITVALPLKIHDETRIFNELIQSVPEGGSIFWASDLSFGIWAEVGSGEIAIYKTFFNMAKERDVKVVLLSFAVDSIAVVDKIMKEFIIPGGFLDDLTYGEDWVWLGYIAGEEAAYAAMTMDIHQSVRSDFYGTPVEEIPCLEGKTTIEDFDLIGWTGYNVEGIARQWGGRKVPFIVSLSGFSLAAAVPWFEGGMIKGYLGAQRGSAEFEKLTGFHGAATLAMDTQSLLHLYAIALLLMSNIYWYAKGGYKKER
jgi:hypothetical protein